MGRVSIGDVDIGGQNTYLYVSNLHSLQIQRFALDGSRTAPELGALTSFDLPAGACPGTTARPWALNADARAGRVLVGVVCTGEEQVFSADSNASDGYVLELHPATTSWTTVTPVDFGYVRGNERCTSVEWLTDSNAYKCESHQRHPWTDGSTQLFWYSQSMIVDIEQLADGALLVGLSDRFD